MGVAIEGSTSAWPGGEGEPVLPRFDVFNQQRRYIEVFTRGQGMLETAVNSTEPWILISAPQSKVNRFGVMIDWAKVPKGLATGAVKISRAGEPDVTVKVEAFNPTEVTRDSLNGFVEGDGYVSIEPEHFTKKIPAGQVRWEKIEDYGKTLSAMTILPMTATSVMPPQGSPCLEYKMYLFKTGTVNVSTILSPSLNFAPGRGVRYAVSFDEQPPIEPRPG